MGLSANGSPIKSIQNVEILLTNVSSNTATITAVNLAKAYVLLAGANASAGTVPTQTEPRVKLTSATQVTAYVNGPSSGVGLTVNATVVEYY